MPSLVKPCGVTKKRRRLAASLRSAGSALSSAEILQANDLLTQGVLLYKQVVEGRVNVGNAMTGAVGDITASRGEC